MAIHDKADSSTIKNSVGVDFPTNYIQISSQVLHYTTRGSGAPVILLHGMGGSLLDWQENIEPLARHYQVFALDIPGFGKSPPPAASTDIHLGYLAKLLYAFIKAEKLPQVCLIGQSLGGGIALEFVLRYPDLVAKLVLVDSAGLGKGVTWPVRLQSIKLLHRLLLRCISKDMVKKTWASMFFDPLYVTDALVERTWHWLQRPETKAFLVEAHATAANLGGQRTVILPELPKIKIPALIIWGANDSVFPVSQAYAAHAHLGNSSLHVFSECGHIPQIEKASEFNRLVTEFFDEQRVEPVMPSA
ncbi:MAG: alpha/beta fold hydrolase [Caldilineaceae bacterium]